MRQELGSFPEQQRLRSPFGFSFNKDIRGQVEARTIVSVARHYTMAFGVSGMHEEVKNSFITDGGFSTFPIKRNDAAVYLENRFELGGRIFSTPGCAANGSARRRSRRRFLASGLSRDNYGANPKLAPAWTWPREPVCIPLTAWD